MSPALTPEVLWAQRSSSSDIEQNYLLVTIMIPDCENPKLELDSTHLDFSAQSPGHVGDEDEHKYRLRIDFYKEIDAEKSLSRVANGRDYFLKLYKKDLDAEYWPRLTKEKLKYHFIKTDFNKWVDEDEQEEEEEEDHGFPGAQGGQGFPGGQGGQGFPGGQGDQAAALQELLKNSGGQGLEGLEALQGLGGQGLEALQGLGADAGAA
ncbi:LANO_0D06964g1_1 [Lachancea nothofagi CBS 11611]|uniref:LANO_0D06964g1_1 n=1 Tax=Lachancea nothofagi CBS 11611 TaxID=1266666 RepID=A0A1G4JHQ1_9SACH|nr:LANO_0D06964g1_1 [Lachancea nothofagi CBS 11611]